MTIAIAIILALFLLFVLSNIGRAGHPGLQVLRGHAYAHRGLHGDSTPENSLEAFRLAKEAGYGVELDVHLLKDGNLAVFHDKTLERMTGREGCIVDLTTEELKDYHLSGTEYTIPTFREVLKLFDGKVPLIVELKEVGNCAALCEKTCKMLDSYKGPYCLESFHPGCIRWLKKNRPDLIRGQLTQNYFAESKAKLPWIVKLALRHQILNFWMRPDFVAYRYSDRETLSNFICRKIWKLQGVTWTLKTQEEFDTATKEDWIPIFEGFRP